MTEPSDPTSAGKLMPERVRLFLDRLQSHGFTVELTRQSPTGGGHKTLRVYWRDVWVAVTNDGIWSPKDLRLIGYRFAKGPGTRTIAEAPEGFDLETFAREHDVDVAQCRVHTEKDGKSYLQFRDEATAWKLLSDWVEVIDGVPLPEFDGGAGQLARDLQDILEEVDLSPTERQVLVAARLGQGVFRQELDREFGGKCAATGLGVRQALRASHIVPWSQATHQQKRDPKNGLLLSANLDALFDRHLITFSPEGELMVSPSLGPEARERLGPLRSLTARPCEARAAYLREHNEAFARRGSVQSAIG